LQILVTETAGRLLDERVDRVDPPVEQMRMHRDGRLDVGGREHDAKQVKAEVACATGDLFFRGGAAQWFELLLSLESLRWFQSPAAGYLPLYDRLFDRGVRVTSGGPLVIKDHMAASRLDHFKLAWLDFGARLSDSSIAQSHSRCRPCSMLTRGFQPKSRWALRVSLTYTG